MLFSMASTDVESLGRFLFPGSPSLLIWLTKLHIDRRVVLQLFSYFKLSLD